MAKKIYLGNLFDSMITALNQTVAKQQEIVDNTQYISNLYDAIDLRQSITYSAGAATLAGALDVLFKGNWYYNSAIVTPTKNKTPETNLSYSGATSTTKKIEFKYSVDLTNISTLKVDMEMANSAHSSAYRTGGIVIAGVTVLSWSATASMARTLLTYDCSSYTGVQEIRVWVGASEATECTSSFKIYSMHLYNASAEIVDVIIPFTNHAISSNSIVMASGALQSVFYINALSTAPVSISKYDLLCILCDLPTGTAIAIDVVKSDFTVLKAAVENGDYIGDLTFLNIYLKITLTRDLVGTPSPTLSTVAFRHII